MQDSGRPLWNLNLWSRHHRQAGCDLIGCLLGVLAERHRRSRLETTTVSQRLAGPWLHLSASPYNLRGAEQEVSSLLSSSDSEELRQEVSHGLT